MLAWQEAEISYVRNPNLERALQFTEALALSLLAGKVKRDLWFFRYQKKIKMFLIFSRTQMPSKFFECRKRLQKSKRGEEESKANLFLALTP